MVEFCYDDDWWLMIDECWYCFSSPSSSCSSFCHIIILYTVYDDQPHSINQSIHTVPHPSHRSCVTWILFWLICKVRLIFLPIQEECCFYIPVSILNKERKKDFVLKVQTTRATCISQLQLFKVFADRCLRVGRAPFGNFLR